MPVQILEGKDHFYIPMDGPWDSEEDNAAFAAANRIYEDIKELHDYVAFIRSYHDYSHGYWVETKIENVQYPDMIIKSNNKKVIEKPADR